MLGENLRLMRQGPEDGDYEANANDQSRRAEGRKEPLPTFPFVGRSLEGLKFTGLLHAFVLSPALMHHFALSNSTREDDRIEREFLWPEMPIEEMEGEDEPCGQQRFITVNDLRDVDGPSGQKPGGFLREPHDKPRKANHGNTPENSHVVELLPVGEPVEGWARPFANEPLAVGNEVP